MSGVLGVAEMALMPGTDDVLVFPLCRMSNKDFDELVNQKGEFSRELIGYPSVVSEDNRVWPNPIKGIELHTVEGAYSKPFFLMKAPSDG